MTDVIDMPMSRPLTAAVPVTVVPDELVDQDFGR